MECYLALYVFTLARYRAINVAFLLSLSPAFIRDFEPV